MTFKNELDILRSFAKKLSRKHQIPHHNAIDIIAKQYGHAHWNALMKAWDNGWCPSPHELVDINEISEPEESDTRGLGFLKTTQGHIAGEPYTLEVGFDYAVIYGTGWAVLFDHAPSKPPEIETYTSPTPLDNKAFLKDVLAIGKTAADGVRKAIALDWPPQSMKPEFDGSAKHPLFGGVSSEWFCMHCEAQSTGAQMAENFWHCPKCNATPLALHPQAWWRESASSS